MHDGLAFIDVPSEWQDFTIGYPGIPPAGYGQSHYTLRSTFMQGNSPPYVHMHFSILSVKSHSDSSSVSPPLGKLPKAAASAAQDSEESTPEEKKAFDDWLLKRWRQKDEQMNRFYEVGDFVEGEHQRGQATKRSNRYVEIPLELRTLKDFVDMFLWGAPVFVIYLLYKLIRVGR
jgi:lysocardiolipin and lysophospholipid acyltransferase